MNSKAFVETSELFYRSMFKQFFDAGLPIRSFSKEFCRHRPPMIDNDFAIPPFPRLWP